MLGNKVITSNYGLMVYKVKILEYSKVPCDSKYPCKETRFLVNMQAVLKIE